MAPVKAGRGADGVDDPGTRTPIVRDRNIPRNVVPTLATPMRTQKVESIEASGSLTRRMTRSMTQTQLDPALGSTPGITTRLQDRLRSASSKSGTNAEPSNLEESRSITYAGGSREENAIDETAEDNGVEEGERAVARRSATRPLPAKQRYSKRISEKASQRTSARNKTGQTTARGSTPSDTVASVGEDGPRLRKRRRLDLIPSKVPLRRSSRLAKPLTAFHKYPDLPIELQMMIWEAAITPRLVYLRNIFTPAGFPTIHNKVPPWFFACKLSLKIALHHYHSLFPVRNVYGQHMIRQIVNPKVDTVLIEPCCNGCRAKNCASRQFKIPDRALIRRIAVQTDSPFLMPTVQPCWASIPEAWPNVNTIYLVKTAIKGDDRQEKAMFRIEEGSYANDLRNRFDDWKKGDGKDKSVQRIEFVRVVEKEGKDIPPKNRYRYSDRMSNRHEDIIIG